MNKKEAILPVLVLFLLVLLTPMTAEAQAVSRDLEVSQNPFIALKLLEAQRVSAEYFSNPEEIRCFLLEEEMSLAQFILMRYFNKDEELTSEGKIYWTSFLLSDASYVYTSNCSSTDCSFSSPHSFVATYFRKARRKEVFCR